MEYFKKGYIILLSLLTNMIVLSALLGMNKSSLNGSLLLLIALFFCLLLGIILIKGYMNYLRDYLIRLSSDISLLLFLVIPVYLIGLAFCEVLSLFVFSLQDTPIMYSVPHYSIVILIYLIIIRNVKSVAVYGGQLHTVNFWGQKRVMLEEILKVKRMNGIFYKITYNSRGNICSFYFITHLFKPDQIGEVKPLKKLVSG